MTELRIEPLASERFDDLVELFGTRGAPSWCWCQYFLTTGRSYEQSAARNRSRLRSQVQSATAPVGLIAYAAGPAPRKGVPRAGHGSPPSRGAAQPVGWVQVGPRPTFPRITASRSLRPVAVDAGDDLDDESVWAVTCFVVKVGWRRHGIATALLARAIEVVREQGASAIVGHPVDVAARGSRIGGSELYHGTASTFAAAGFEVVGRTGATRPVMRLRLTGR
ncbi:GNAT family N-acetyltransferase [Intrasporangium sp. DVR]|uniref:GNAT family N-acetyltransferase n=1 Tax=Intrasporangium sp. DVR TaxID=3127867 RepID=UPI00313A67BB